MSYPHQHLTSSEQARPRECIPCARYLVEETFQTNFNGVVFVKAHRGVRELWSVNGWIQRRIGCKPCLRVCQVFSFRCRYGFNDAWENSCLPCSQVSWSQSYGNCILEFLEADTIFSIMNQSQDTLIILDYDKRLSSEVGHVIKRSQ